MQVHPETSPQLASSVAYILFYSKEPFCVLLPRYPESFNLCKLVLFFSFQLLETQFLSLHHFSLLFLCQYSGTHTCPSPPVAFSQQFRFLSTSPVGWLSPHPYLFLQLCGHRLTQWQLLSTHAQLHKPLGGSVHVILFSGQCQPFLRGNIAMKIGLDFPGLEINF